MESKKQPKEQRKFVSKSGIYAIAILFFLGIIVYNAANLSSIFSTGFSADVFVYPLMFMKRLIPNTLFILVVVVFLVVYGIKHQKLWYLIPVAIVFVGLYWFSINNSVYKAYVKRFMTTQE